MQMMSRSAITAAAIGLLAFGSAQAQEADTTTPPQVRHLTKCPDNIADFIDSDATAPLVKKCLGKPAFENRRPDGAFSWVFPSRDGKLVMAFAFNPDGSLMRARAYAQD
jgi:Cu/Ag efflux pump CusA